MYSVTCVIYSAGKRLGQLSVTKRVHNGCEVRVLDSEYRVAPAKNLIHRLCNDKTIPMTHQVKIDVINTIHRFPLYFTIAPRVQILASVLLIFCLIILLRQS